MEKKISLLKEIISKNLIETIRKATTKPPEDLISLIKKTASQEQNLISKTQYDLILENFEYGSQNSIPLCQDTGVLNFFIELGNEFPIISNFKDLIEAAILKATEQIPLRGNTVNPITNENPENNLGVNAPQIYIDIIENSSNLKITVLPKGGGSENISKLFMLNPSTGLEEFKDKIINAVKDAGGMPCPPIILGIGIGGDATACMNLAKKALLRPLNQPHEWGNIANLEKELKQKINDLNIGGMGLGGQSTCLAVHINIAMRHPASFPVGMVVQCYSHRIASFQINREGTLINDL